MARRGGAKKLRDSGRVPAVIYGGKTKPQNLELKSKDLENLIQHSVSENILLDLAVEGDGAKTRLALLKEVQHHPLKSQILHVDLHEVAEDEKVTVMVPVETVGEAAGEAGAGTETGAGAAVGPASFSAWGSSPSSRTIRSPRSRAAIFRSTSSLPGWRRMTSW